MRKGGMVVKTKEAGEPIVEFLAPQRREIQVFEVTLQVSRRF